MSLWGLRTITDSEGRSCGTPPGSIAPHSRTAMLQRAICHTRHLKKNKKKQKQCAAPCTQLNSLQSQFQVWCDAVVRRVLNTLPMSDDTPAIFRPSSYTRHFLTLSTIRTATGLDDERTKLGKLLRIDVLKNIIQISGLYDVWPLGL